jgi:hypothetical protein
MKLAKLKAKSLYAVTAKKVAADQLVAAPIVLFTIMSAVYLMEGHTVEQTKEKLKNDYCEVLLTNYKVSQYFFYSYCNRYVSFRSETLKV